MSLREKIQDGIRDMQENRGARPRTLAEAQKIALHTYYMDECGRHYEQDGSSADKAQVLECTRLERMTMGSAQARDVDTLANGRYWPRTQIPMIDTSLIGSVEYAKRTLDVLGRVARRTGAPERFSLERVSTEPDRVLSRVFDRGRPTDIGVLTTSGALNRENQPCNLSALVQINEDNTVTAWGYSSLGQQYAYVDGELRCGFIGEWSEIQMQAQVAAYRLRDDICVARAGLQEGDLFAGPYDSGYSPVVMKSLSAAFNDQQLAYDGPLLSGDIFPEQRRMERQRKRAREMLFGALMTAKVDYDPEVLNRLSGPTAIPQVPEPHRSSRVQEKHDFGIGYGAN